MVKKAPQDLVDPSLQMKVIQMEQYLVTARKLPTQADSKGKVYAMRVFARNHVVAKTRFWWNMRKLNKLKKANGQILAVQELFEKRRRAVKTFGIVLRYQSRTTYHNMYKEFRDVSLNGAISQMYQEMAGMHRANPNSIQIIRTAVVTSKDEVKRGKSWEYRGDKLKFPLVKTLPRASHKKFRTVFKAQRPNLYKS